MPNKPDQQVLNLRDLTETELRYYLELPLEFRELAKAQLRKQVAARAGKNFAEQIKARLNRTSYARKLVTA